jgi:nitrogen fixation NifU-like protein
MYQEILLEHSRDPHHFGELASADLKAEGYNPLCGDKICLQLKLGEGTKTADVRFKGEACSICMASASILTDEIENRTLTEIQAKVHDFRELMQGRKDPEDFEGDISSLAGVRNFPVRIKCALLPWTTLNEAIETHLSTHLSKEGA